MRAPELTKDFAATRLGVIMSPKDGAIKHVVTGVNPQGIDVNSFKVPSAVALTHDYQQRENLAAIGKQLGKRVDGGHNSAATVAVTRSRQPQLNGSS